MSDQVLPNGCRWVDLPQAVDERGGLTYVEEDTDVPIEIQRVYYIYNVPSDKVRGEHAHEELKQVLVAANGSFTLELDDGSESVTVTLDNPARGVYVPGMTWREMREFAPETVCLVLASAPYDEDDYLHDYETFLSAARGSSN